MEKLDASQINVDDVNITIAESLYGWTYEDESWINPASPGRHGQVLPQYHTDLALARQAVRDLSEIVAVRFLEQRQPDATSVQVTWNDGRHEAFGAVAETDAELSLLLASSVAKVLQLSSLEDRWSPFASA